MGEVTYLGETLWIHNLGHFLLLLSFVAAGFSAFSYLKDTLHLRDSEEVSSWQKLGRIGFTIHGVAILSVIAMIFYAMATKMFEYYYVFQHVNSELPNKYILSAFWEGQEGSFMLWMFWHVILGFIVMLKSDKWQSPVIFTIAMAQLFINMMILGIHIEIGDYIAKIGSNPFVLLRQSIDAPIFSNADYLSLIEGNGLNPLLQNYWNTIHPPVLFLGFASTIIPFGYVMGGLLTGRHKEWLRPAIGWALFSTFIFGVGILMGSAWAYEALTFGGFWAWDPVENSSFVPWVALVAGVHVHLIAMNTGYSIRSTYFLYILAFILVIYSTFLTRSGVLGDTSVHAFTEMGLETQLLMFLGLFSLLGFGAFIYNFKSISEPKKEESIYSREFWMFIGSLVLMFSAILIIGATSLPVFNKIVDFFNPGYEGLVIQDPIEHYNKYQIWIASFIGVLSAFGVFLKYRALPFKASHWKKILTPLGFGMGMAVLSVVLLEQWIVLEFFQYRILALLCFFTIYTNLYYLLSAVRKDARLGASGLSHAGFAIMVIGVLASGLNNRHISQDPFGERGTVPDDQLNKLVFLLKDIPKIMNGYQMEYVSDTLIERERYFTVNFTQYDDDGTLKDQFTLTPSVLLSNDKQTVKAQIPSTRHYFTYDIFTHVQGLPPYKRDAQEAQEVEDSLKYINYNVAIGDTFSTQNYKGKLESITYTPTNKNFNPANSDLAIGLNLSFWEADVDTIYKVQPVLSLDNALIITIGELINNLELKVRVNDTLMNDLIAPQSELNYESFTIKAGEYIKYQGHDIVLAGFNQEPENRLYVKEEEDIALAAKISIDNQYNIEPIFLIRDGQQMHFNEYVPQVGMHIRFVNIDPQKEEFTFLIGKEPVRTDMMFPIEVAENAPRNDWIYLEARLFPGINLFWVGSITMLLGFLWSLVMRAIYKSKKSTA